MTEVEALAAKLREAEETIRQLQARLKEVEAERDEYGSVVIYKPVIEEGISIADFCKDTNQFVEECLKGNTVPFEDIVREVEERVRMYELEDQANASSDDAREPAA